MEEKANQTERKNLVDLSETKEKALGMWGAFKKFAFKGNVIDMATGVVIGGAFGKIVSSIVADIITPLISLLTGQVKFSELSLLLREAVMDGETEISPAITLNYGTLLETVIDFFLIALSVFVVVKLLTARRDKLAAEAAAKAAEEAERLAAEEAAEAERLAAEEAAKPHVPDEKELLTAILEELRKR